MVAPCDSDAHTRQRARSSPHRVALHPWYVCLQVVRARICGLCGDNSSPLSLACVRRFFPLTLRPATTSIHVPIRYSSSPPSSALGNPGLLDFYVPFLNAIHRETVSESSDSNASPSSSSVTTIFAHAHLGLSSYLDTDGSSSSFPETSSVSLPAQVEAHLEFLDELLVAYGGHRDSDPATRVLLVGHSIGAWFVQELLKARAAHWQLRSRVLLGAFLLFPTISNIGQSPCGRTLSVCVLPLDFLTLVFANASLPRPSLTMSFAVRHLLAGAQASISPAVAPHTGTSLPAHPTPPPMHPPHLPAILANESVAGPAPPPARSRGHIRGSDDGARRDGEGARA